MLLRYVDPPPSLRDVVDHYLVYDLSASEAEREFPDGMHVLPSPYGRMGLFFGTPTVRRVDGAVVGHNPQIGVSGFYTQPRNYLTRDPVSMLIVGFTPLGLQQIVDLPLAELANRNVDAADLFDDHERLLHEVSVRTDWPGRLAIVSRFLAARCRRVEPDARAEQAVACLLGAAGRRSIRETADELVVSERTLRRVFTRQAGISPKAFAGIARIQEAAGRLLADPRADLAQLAVSCGYFDQAHLSHEFAAYLGHSPRAFAALPRSAIGRLADRRHRVGGHRLPAYV